MKNKLYASFLFILSFFVPKKKELIIFGGGDGIQFQGNPKFLFLYLHQIGCKDLEYYWSAKAAKQREFLKQHHLPFINPYTLKGFIKLLRANFLVIEKSTADVYYIRQNFGHFKFIQTWHGTPLKRLENITEASKDVENIGKAKTKTLQSLMVRFGLTSRQRFFLITAPNERIKRIFENHFLNKNVVITGYSRNDILFHPAMSTMDYKKRLKLEPFKNVLLYAPTWRDNQENLTPFSNDLNPLNDLLKDKNYVLLVKKHPWQKDLSIPSNFTNIRDVSLDVIDIQELYPFVDVLINDYSSAVFDFILTKRPVIFYPYDFKEYLQKCRGLYFDYFEDQPGPFAQNETELMNLIGSLETWSTTPSYQSAYDAFVDKFNYYKDGNSCVRLFQLIYPNLNFKPL